MRRSRTWILLAAVLALALVAAACGGDDGGGSSSDDSTGGGGAGVDASECPTDALDAAAGPVDITLWHSYSANIEIALNTVADDYNASQDAVVVNVQNQGAAYEELQRKFNQAISSGDLPNITIMEDTQNQFMADSGVVVPAAACIEASGDQPDFLEAPVSYYSIDGVLWPAGFNLSTPIMYFNKGHFEDAGLDPESPPQTLDEIRAAAEAIQDAGVADTPFVFLLQPWFIETWLTGISETVVNENNGRDALATEATLESDAFLDILTWLKDMNDDGLLLPFAATDGQINHYLALAQGNGSMGIETSAAATAIESFLKGELDPSELSDDARVVVTEDLDLSLDIGATQFPGVEEAGRVQVGGGAYFMTNSGTDEQIAASWDFMSYLNTVESQVTNNLVGSYLPSLTTAPDDPQITETWDTTLSGQWLALSYEQLVAVDPAFPGPTMGPYTDERDILKEGLEALLLEGASPEDVQADMQERVTEALELYEDQNF
jgi:sn-glycerol 3-phosphate transport system substrate-binding protein